MTLDGEGFLNPKRSGTHCKERTEENNEDILPLRSVPFPHSAFLFSFCRILHLLFLLVRRWLLDADIDADIDA